MSERLSGLLVRTLLVLAVVACALPTLAFRDPDAPSRFAALTLPDPGQVVGIRTAEVSSLDGGDPLRAGWERFKQERGGWKVWTDERSGLPTLAYGAGIAWVPGRGNALEADGPVTLESLEELARGFLEEQKVLLAGLGGRLVLDREASGLTKDQVWLVVFRQEVGGVRVEEARFDFHVAHGNLVSFGATRWGEPDVDPAPTVSRDQALGALRRYLEIPSFDGAEFSDEGSLSIVPRDPSGDPGSAWFGARGLGYEHMLTWRFGFAYPGEPETWMARVDAHTGQVVALVDETMYARIKGGIYPLTNDGSGPDAVEQPDFPMPYADYSIDGGADVLTGDYGAYTCAEGESVGTNLVGTYVRINDVCGSTSESTTCPADLDLGMASGIDCNVQSGSSPGNTGAARSCYYHTTRVKEQALYWLPSNTWLNGVLTCRSNVNSTCNATYSGQLNMYRDGGSACRNTGENQGVVVHEWGHGMDSNDGGGGDNPGEGYADVSAILYGRISCIGPGFYKSQTCTGYGDTCLTCTGIREMDWDARESHTPATPANFEDPNCSGGSGPCGSAVHCSSYVPSESIFDLATRDLPASGMDQDTAWQHTEQLWYLSRQGSGGPAYNCSLPNSDGCGTVSWFHKMRVADDDDGNLANGTPNAAAIFAAFDRHAIACGAASDPENQSTSSCPAMGAPVLSATARSEAIDLEWSGVGGAAYYRVLRNDLGCHRAQIAVADVSDVSYLDGGLANEFPVYYRVQAVGSNPACTSPVSNCVEAMPVPVTERGTIDIETAVVACVSSVPLKVADLDLDLDPNQPDTVSVTITSSTETTAEAVVLTETGDDTSFFTGTIDTADGPAVPGDGVLQVTDGDAISATYADEDTGDGGAAFAFDSAAVDCTGSGFPAVQVVNVTDNSADVYWETTEATTGVVEWGTTSALGNMVSSVSLATSHQVTLSPLAECGRLYFRIRATDKFGNPSVSDVAGSPYEFNAGLIGGAVFKDGFESSSGWSLTGEWEIGAPQGLGSAPSDPVAAFAGSGVVGQDLSGTGANPGDYEPFSNTTAESPSVDASGLSSVELKIRRWLNVGIGGVATIDVKQGGTWNQVWSDADGQQESTWTFQTIDISSFAAGNGDLQVRFGVNTGPAGFPAAGWNIDRFVIRDATQPEWASCGGCGGAPTFAGLSAASDVDGCGDSGVALSWEAAPSWGTGDAGTYAVYRSTDPAFVPSGANLVQSGVAGTGFTDTSAPDDQDLYYVVRAESNETCAAGPNNGGTVDTNLVRVAARDDTSQPAPGAVGDTLLAEGINRAHVLLSWGAGANAASYHVNRSGQPDTGFGLLADPAGTSYEDRDQYGDPQSYYYLVRGADTCGNEGP